MDKIILMHYNEKSIAIKTGEITQHEVFSIVALINALVSEPTFKFEDISANIQTRLNLNTNSTEVIAVMNI